MLAKLVPAGDRYELRVKGPNVMPGYYRNPEATAEAFDEEGFFRTGDAARWVDESRPEAGIAFAGRLSEEFKLVVGHLGARHDLAHAADRRAAALCPRPGDRGPRSAMARCAGLARCDGLHRSGRRNGVAAGAGAVAHVVQQSARRVEHAHQAACCRSTSRRSRRRRGHRQALDQCAARAGTARAPTWRGSMPIRPIRRSSADAA